MEEERPSRPLSHEEEKRVKARLGDLLMKEWTLVGIPAVVIALTALAKVEKYKEENVQVPEKRFVSLITPLFSLYLFFSLHGVKVS